MGDLPSPIRIRAHHLLCLQGFQGFGYSEEFIAQMRRVHRLLRMKPDTDIQVLIGADILCEHCPHHYRGRCTIDDPEDQPIETDTPDQAVLKDRRTLSWLELENESVQLWGQVVYKVGRLVDSTAMNALCRECKWREEDYCANALDELNQKVTSGELLFPAISKSTEPAEEDDSEPSMKEGPERETGDKSETTSEEIPDSKAKNNSEPADSLPDRT